MTIEQEVLSYLGVSPVLPNRPFFGATETNGFDGAWEIKTRANQREKLSPQTAKAAQVGQARSHAQDLAAQFETKPVSDASSIATTGESPSKQEAIVSPLLDETKNSARDNTAVSTVAKDAAVEKNEESVQFDIYVLLHEPLGILVLAEIESGSSKQMELSFLKRILKSFSEGQTQYWAYEQFSWPPKQQRLAHLRSNKEAAAEAFQGYLESKQDKQLRHVLCFSDGYLKAFLNNRKDNELDKLESKLIQKVQSEKFKFSIDITLIKSLSLLISKKELKSELWGYIQETLLK